MKLKSQGNDAPFFVGWSNDVPGPLALFLVAAASLFVGGLAGLAFAIGASVDDPGAGYVARDLGPQHLMGVLEEKPYPLLRIPPSKDFPNGRALMLIERGKRGVQARIAKIKERRVEAGGILLKRGTMDMLGIGRKIGIRPATDEALAKIGDYTPPKPESLGRWRLSGEICDGKCYVGAMRPGRGLSHKACANLCIEGGAPPVFVSTAPVEGASFFLLADPEGNPLPDSHYDLVALMIEIEGDVERRGNLLVFKIDVGEAKVL